MSHFYLIELSETGHCRQGWQLIATGLCVPDSSPGLGPGREILQRLLGMLSVSAVRYVYCSKVIKY